MNADPYLVFLAAAGREVFTGEILADLLIRATRRAWRLLPQPMPG